MVTPGFYGDDWRSQPRSAIVINHHTPERYTLSLGSLPPIYSGTIAPWSNNRKQMSLAYLFLLGRVPDIGGLDYWIGEAKTTFGVTGDTLTFSQCFRRLHQGLEGLLIEPVDNGFGSGLFFMKDIYVHVLGEAFEDIDRNANPVNVTRDAVEYWGTQIDDNDGGEDDGTPLLLRESRANVCDAVLSILLGGGNDLATNRFLILEAAVRAQIHVNKDLSYQSAETVTRMVVGTTASFDDAMSVIDNYIINNNTKPSNAWFKTYSQAGIVAESVDAYDESAPSSTNIKKHKYLAWWNRNSDLLLVHAFLPSGFSSVTTNTLRCVVSLHGGGWRGGTIERIQDYNVRIADASAAPVVLSPEYRRTRAPGQTYPAANNDLVDFKALIEGNPTLFRLNTSKISYFGESAGGNLVMWLGSTQNVGRVCSLSAVVDLTNNTSTQLSKIRPFIDSFTGESSTNGTNNTNEIAASPYHQWSSTRTTDFQVHHGDDDNLVPAGNADVFKLLTGSKTTKYIYYDALHIFGGTDKSSVISRANAMFNI